MKVTPVRKKFGKYSPGDEFELPDKSARLFIKVGKLEQVIDQKVVVPEPVKVDEDQEISPRTGLPKRTYRRRDMEAE